MNAYSQFLYYFIGKFFLIFTYLKREYLLSLIVIHVLIDSMTPANFL